MMLLLLLLMMMMVMMISVEMVVIVMTMTMMVGALDEISFASFPTWLHPSNLTFGSRRASDMTPTNQPSLIADDVGDDDDGNENDGNDDDGDNNLT